jgi:FAD/FMN-containing dehydrogenase
MSNVLSEPEAAGSATQSKVQSPKSKVLSKYFDPESAKAQLASIVGAANISASPSLPLSPSPLTVTPGSVDEVCEVMKLASSEGWGVVPAGAMTWLDAGQPLQRANIIVSTQRLNRIVEHEPADLVAIAEAGVTLNDFNATLSQKGQWLPVDPPDAIGRSRATIGGVVATGLSGAQQFGYGPPRKHVIGMKVVMADGRLIKAGGRVVKNVAGYDLCKLFTGSYGTLGVIVEVNFKLRPVPFETRTIVAWGAREDLLAGARRVIDARLFPVAVELLSPLLAREAQQSEGTDHLLLIRFAGSLSAVTQQTIAAKELMGEGQSQQSARVEADDANIWQSLASLPLQFPDDLVWRVGFRPGDLSLFLTEMDQRNDPEPRWHAGVGDGRIRVVERLQQTDNWPAVFLKETVARIEALRASATNLGGALIIEQAPPELKHFVNAWGNLGPAVALMQRVKNQLDPDDIFSSGRFV